MAVGGSFIMVISTKGNLYALGENYKVKIKVFYTLERGNLVLETLITGTILIKSSYQVRRG